MKVLQLIVQVDVLRVVLSPQGGGAGQYASDLYDLLPQHSSHFSCFITVTADTTGTTLEKRQWSVRMISEGGNGNLQPETQKVQRTKRMERSDRAAEQGSVDRQTERQELPLSFQRERRQAAPAERTRHRQPELAEWKRQQVHQQNEPVWSLVHW